MYRSWLHPMFDTVPYSTRMQGALPIAFYGAIDPASWVKSPYIGVITFVVVWWILWNLNLWGMIRFEGETEDQYWRWWIVRSLLYSFFLTWIPLFFVYLAILLVIKLSVSIRLR